MEHLTERERSGDKPKSTNKPLPKDAQVIMSIMKQMHVNNYDQRVINQLLEFTYRYVTCLLEDAKAFANHARKKCIEVDDVKLATSMVSEKSFTPPPPTEVLLDVARNRNAIPIPTVKINCGLRLPPERHCLLSANYKLKASEIPKRLTKASKNRSSGVSNLKRQQNSKAIKPGAMPRPVIKVGNGKTMKIPNKPMSKTTEKFVSISEPIISSISKQMERTEPIVGMELTDSEMTDEPIFKDMHPEYDTIEFDPSD